MSRCQVAGGLMILNAEAVAAGQASQQIIIRTRFWDDALLDAQDDGVSQVVILAAGMDARAYRLPWRAGTTVYEVDQPQVIAAKDERLAGERPRLSAKTVWLVEGLRQYLDASAVDTLGVGRRRPAAPISPRSGSCCRTGCGRPLCLRRPGPMCGKRWCPH